MRKRMSWQRRELCLMEDIWHKNLSQLGAAKEERGKCGASTCGQFTLSGGQKKHGSLLKGRWRRTKHRAECCATSEKYRCMRCGKNSRNIRMLGRFDGPSLMTMTDRAKWGGPSIVGERLACELPSHI